MFTQLQDTFAPANAAAAFKDWHLDPHKALGPDIQAHANACHSEAADLASIAVRLHDTACAVPTCRDTMRVDYIWQVALSPLWYILCLMFCLDWLKYSTSKCRETVSCWIRTP